MRLGFVTSLLLLMIAFPVTANEQLLTATTTLKITIDEADMTEKFEFHNPNQYTYMKNKRHYHGEQAEKAMNNILQDIHLSNEVSIEELVSQLRTTSFNDLTHLEIRWLTDKNELYTWVWNSD